MTANRRFTSQHGSQRVERQPSRDMDDRPTAPGRLNVDELRLLRAILDGIHVVHGIRALCIAVLIVLCSTARHADASCTVALEGDATIVERIRTEINDFADDLAPCLALWVQCRRNIGQLEIELHDELGRWSVRSFDTEGGAAAFIVSWSRRPLAPASASIDRRAALAAGPPGTLALSSPPSPSTVNDQPWHPELRTAFVAATGDFVSWATIAASMVQRTGRWRYGFTARGIARPVHWSADVEASFGRVQPLPGGLTVVGELVVGTTFIAENVPANTGYGARGSRAGLRARVGWPMTASLALEASVGLDYTSQEILEIDGFQTHNELHYFGQLDVGLRWMP
jgi:hypothetical protein